MLHTAGQILLQRTYFAFVLYSGGLVLAPFELVHVLRLVDDGDQVETELARIDSKASLNTVSTVGKVEQLSPQDVQIGVTGASTLTALTRISKCKSEGFWRLWKGHLVSWFRDVVHALVIQPTMEQLIGDIFRSAKKERYEPLRIVASVIVSNTLTGVLLSPLDLVRTRIMVQSSEPQFRMYRSIPSAIREVIHEAGSFQGLYPTHRMIPTILLKTVQSVCDYAIPSFIEHIYGIDPDMSPLLYQTLKFGLGVVELLVTYPLETVVRRMECQVDAEKQHPPRSFVGMIALEQKPYTSGWNCVERILRKESQRLRRNGSKDELASVSALYRGFGLHFTTHTAISILRFIADK